MSLPSYMNAVVLESHEDGISYVEGIRIPELESGQVLVKVYYSGICGSQLIEISGGRGEDHFLPHLLGHEASGEVISAAKDVTKVRIGDSVILSWIRGIGISSTPPTYSLNGRKINAGQIATLCNYAVVSENTLFKTKLDITDPFSALLGCAIPTGAGIAINQILGDLSKKDIAIFGLGGIGISALLALKDRAPRRIFGVDLDEQRLNSINKFADFIPINAKHQDAVTKILNETNGLGVDFSIDASGSTKSIENAFNSIRNQGGTCIIASHPPEGQRISIDPFDLIRGKNLIGSWGGQVNLDNQLEVLSKIILDNEAGFSWLSHTQYSLQNTDQAILDMKSSKVIRPLIKMEH